MKCKVCGKNAESEYCFQHSPRKGFKKTGKLKPKKPKEREIIWSMGSEAKKALDKAFVAQSMHEFFKYIWSLKRHISEVSGTYLGREPSSGYFHHILPKSKYEEAAYDKENIILLTLEEHANVENNMYRYDEVNKRRESLIKKYDL